MKKIIRYLMLNVVIALVILLCISKIGEVETLVCVGCSIIFLAVLVTVLNIISE